MTDTIWCEHPRQCPFQHTCATNLDNHSGPLPAVRVFQRFVAPIDGRCPGFRQIVLQPDKKKLRSDGPPLDFESQQHEVKS